MRAGPVFFLLLKWIAIPVALLGVGFYFVGPSIGKSDMAQSLGTPPSPDQTAESDKPKLSRHGEPQVEVVSVQPGGRFNNSSTDYSSDLTARRSGSNDLTSPGDQPKTKKHRKRHRTESTEPPPDIPFDLGPPPSGPPTGDTGGGPGGPGGPG